MIVTGAEKSVVAILGTAVTSILALVPPESVLSTVLTIVAAVLTAVGVYMVPNSILPGAAAVVVTDDPAADQPPPVAAPEQ